MKKNAMTMTKALCCSVLVVLSGCSGDPTVIPDAKTDAGAADAAAEIRGLDIIWPDLWHLEASVSDLPRLADAGPCQSDADCDDKLSCTLGRCQDGSCSYLVAHTHCVINGTCVEAEVCKPTGNDAGSTDCAYKCVPARNPWGYSKVEPWVSTLAGDTHGDLDGPVTEALFNRPMDVAVGPSGELYVADLNNHKIRKIEGGQVTTVAGTGVAGSTDGPVATATLTSPRAVAVGPGGEIFVAQDFCIRVISGGKVDTLAGNCGQAGDVAGVGTSARFNHISGIGTGLDVQVPGTSIPYESGSSVLHVSDKENYKIRKVYITAGGARYKQVVDLTGKGSPGSTNGALADALFNFTQKLEVWDGGKKVLVADYFNQQIRSIGLSVNQVVPMTWPLVSPDYYPVDMTWDYPALFVVVGSPDAARGALYQVSSASNGLVPVGGSASAKGYIDGPAGSARLDRIAAAEIWRGRRVIYLCEDGASKSQIRVYSW